MKAKLRTNDDLNRWEAGEIGDLLKHTSKKYKYFVALSPRIIKAENVPHPPPWFTLDENGETYTFARNFYFYEHEVEVLDNGRNEDKEK